MNAADGLMQLAKAALCISTQKLIAAGLHSKSIGMVQRGMKVNL